MANAPGVPIEYLTLEEQAPTLKSRSEANTVGETEKNLTANLEEDAPVAKPWCKRLLGL